ncbi:MAG: molybdate ABC transporter substrate-binding protein [Spirochaetaceae bacterium]|nr:molybdate ABC transporter substrate-binding protein [Spirochaetaceae bacterium]
MFTALVLVSLAANGVSKSGRSHPLQFFVASSTADLALDWISVLRPPVVSEQKSMLTITPGSTGTLARQVAAGADVELFLSADTRWVQWLTERSLVAEATPIMANNLAIVGPLGSESLSIDSSLPEGRWAVGDPYHVPAGRYAQQALEKLGWWAEMQDRIIPTADVRAALALVEMGEADWGIVYTTDAVKSSKVDILAVLPPNLHDEIIYTLLIVNDSSSEAFEVYHRLLGSNQARESAQERGFQVLPTWMNR